jgi:hypothetical protein
MNPQMILGFLMSLLDFVVGYLGVEKTKALLDLDAVQKANAVADALEVIKFGKTSGKPPEA